MAFKGKKLKHHDYIRKGRNTVHIQLKISKNVIRIGG